MRSLALIPDRVSDAQAATLPTAGLTALRALEAGGLLVGDLARLCRLVESGRLDGQIALECSWRQPQVAIDALLHRHLGGKIVLRMDRP
ncbi:MAG TPA: hypothetical protein VFI65_00070 [Streptosporangiaceae bacterium]|nr:hypothetical protein [Streptosporangiaceae bacterium]